MKSSLAQLAQHHRGQRRVRFAIIVALAEPEDLVLRRSAQGNEGVELGCRPPELRRKPRVSLLWGHGLPVRAAVEGYRKSIGRVTLIGLEILVAATIITTIIVNPTLEGLGYLVSMVAIRTLLG